MIKSSANTGGAKIKAYTLRARKKSPRSRSGFTMIEVMVVVVIVAIAAAVASLALPDQEMTLLEREATRLGVILESARVEGRAAGVAMSLSAMKKGDFDGGTWSWGGAGGRQQAESGERSVASLADGELPVGFINPGASLELFVSGRPAKMIRLGPEPIIAPTRVRIHYSEKWIELSTDGFSPFEVSDRSQ